MIYDEKYHQEPFLEGQLTADKLTLILEHFHTPKCLIETIEVADDMHTKMRHFNITLHNHESFGMSVEEEALEEIKHTLNLSDWNKQYPYGLAAGIAVGDIPFFTTGIMQSSPAAIYYHSGSTRESTRMSPADVRAFKMVFTNHVLELRLAESDKKIEDMRKEEEHGRVQSFGNSDEEASKQDGQRAGESRIRSEATLAQSIRMGWRKHRGN